MPRLIVKFSHQKNQRYELRIGETTIGRGEESSLRLPNVSVSRGHAKITTGRAIVKIEDAESQNGIMVNGEKVTERVLQGRDEIQIGRFTLVYLSDDPEDRFHKGRYVEYLPAYEPTSITGGGNEAATFVLDAETLRKMQEGNHLVENARLISDDSENKFWYPEDRALTFGKKGMVPVKGWFTWGVVAEVKWDGKRHVLQRTGLAGVRVNEVKVQERPLRHGDRVRIGGTGFRYEAPKD